MHYTISYNLITGYLRMIASVIFMNSASRQVIWVKFHLTNINDNANAQYLSVKEKTYLANLFWKYCQI